jgi:hypothetical protein
MATPTGITSNANELHNRNSATETEGEESVSKRKLIGQNGK